MTTATTAGNTGVTVTVYWTARPAHLIGGSNGTCHRNSVTATPLAWLMKRRPSPSRYRLRPADLGDRRRLAVLTPCRTCVLLNFSGTDFYRAPCGGRALAYIKVSCLNVNYQMGIYANITNKGSAAEFLCRLPADADKFRCRTNRETSVQTVDITCFLGARRAIFGRHNAFSP